MAATKADAPGATPALNFEVINAWADARDLSRGELAERLGIDRTTLWRWQQGLAVPTFEAVCGVAESLGLTVDEVRSRGSRS